MLASLHAQGGHAGRAVTLAAVGGEKGEPHGVWDAARAQRAPWKEGKQQASVTVHILSPRTRGGGRVLIDIVWFWALKGEATNAQDPKDAQLKRSSW